MARAIRVGASGYCAATIALLTCFNQAVAQPFEWVPVAGGCFVMGSVAFHREEQPVSNKCVASFEMMATEVTNAQFTRFVADTGYITDAERGWHGGDGTSETLPGSAVFVAPKKIDRSALNWWQFTPGANWRKPFGPDGQDRQPDAPVVHVTYSDAQAFADWLGARLPTEAEWEFAARGAKPPSDSLDANTWQGLFPIVDSGRDGFAGVAPVGSFPANAKGLHDLLGNVWELTSTPYSPSHDSSTVSIAGERGFDPAQPKAAVVVIKGGSFLCTRDFCYRYRPAARQAQDRSLSTSHIGFRLVRDLQDSDS
ncbi:MAG: formylglycine-generating enzyme family protein [Pseudomonadota bacterium]